VGIDYVEGWSCDNEDFSRTMPIEIYATATQGQTPCITHEGKTACRVATGVADKRREPKVGNLDISASQFALVLPAVRNLLQQNGWAPASQNPADYHLHFFLIDAEALSAGEHPATGIALSVRELAVEQIRQ
jgi:hypothetical protein